MARKKKTETETETEKPQQSGWTVPKVAITNTSMSRWTINGEVIAANTTSAISGETYNYLKGHYFFSKMFESGVLS